MILIDPSVINYESILNDYYSYIKQQHKQFASDRGWEYDLVYKLGDFDKNSLILDIGGGYSYLFMYLSKFVKYSYAVDSLLNAKYPFKGVDDWYRSIGYYDEILYGKAIFVCHNAKELPFPDNYFDTIYTISAMEHFEDTDDTECVKEIKRCLKPNGIFLGTVDYNPISEYPENDILRFYTYESFMGRVVEPSGLKLDGDDMVKGLPIPEKVDYIEISLFFKLRK